MDFTIDIYRRLLEALKLYGFESLTLRHDVDLRPYNSLRTARLEAQLGLYGIYYFRAVPESWNDEIIREIAALGHEVGYHYESLTTCNGDIDAANQDFCQNLEKLRKLVPVKSICMHGSPRSRHDNRDMWKKYSYRDLSIEGEPYLDTEFSSTLYLSDTGRRWDGYKVSIRDKIEGFQTEWQRKGWVFHTTDDIIKGLETGKLPDRLMLTTHPQRWNDFGARYLKELFLQKAKNAVKYFLTR